MAIYKRCSRCNKRIPTGSKCECIKTRHKEYRKYRTDSKEQRFYNSNEWSIVRDKAIARFDGLDIYSYYILKEIEYGYTVHHIEELKDNWDRRLDIDNLVYLTESNHQLIHKKMRASKEDKTDLINMLNDLIKRYLEEFK